MGVGSLPQREREGNWIILLAVGVFLSPRTYRGEAPFGKLNSALCKQYCFFPHLNKRDVPVQVLQTGFSCSDWMQSRWTGKEEKLQDLNVGLVSTESVPYICL